jgi:hypothetical protein
VDLKAGVALQWVVVIRALRNSGFAALRTFQFKFKPVARCHNAEYVLFGRTGKAFSQPYSKLTHYMRNSQGHIAADVACYNRLMGMMRGHVRWTRPSAHCRCIVMDRNYYALNRQ